MTLVRLQPTIASVSCQLKMTALSSPDGARRRDRRQTRNARRERKRPCRTRDVRAERRLPHTRVSIEHWANGTVAASIGRPHAMCVGRGRRADRPTSAAHFFWPEDPPYVETTKAFAARTRANAQHSGCRLDCFSGLHVLCERTQRECSAFTPDHRLSVRYRTERKRKMLKIRGLRFSFVAFRQSGARCLRSSILPSAATLATITAAAKTQA